MPDALELAIAAYRAPRLGLRLQTRALPADTLEVIRIAAGDELAAEEAIALTGLSREELREACALYLQQALFCQDADSYRTLGLERGAPQRQIKEHHRWLIHWLHPDRDRGAEFSVFSERVNRAWNDLRKPERRSAYDDLLDKRAERIAAETPWADAEMVDSGRAPRRRFAASMMSGHIVRRLPQIVVGGLAGLTVLLIATLLMLHFSNDGEAELQSSPAANGNTAAVRSASAAHTQSGTRDVNASAAVRSPAAPSTMTSAASAGNDAIFVPALTTAAQNPAVANAAPVANTREDTRAPSELANTQNRATATSRDARVLGTPAQTPSAVVAETKQDAAVAIGKKTPETPPSAVGVQLPIPISATERVGAPTPVEAQGALERMQSAYRSGDLSAMMDLFAHEPVGESRASLADGYRELFSNSRERSLVLRNFGWLIDQDLAIGLGDYETVVVTRGSSRLRVAAGTMRVELRIEDGQARIVRLTHDHADGS